MWLTKDAPEPNAEFEKELKGLVRSKVGAFATPDTFHYAPTGLPKTRSGKIMRRNLRKIAALGPATAPADLGDYPLNQSRSASAALQKSAAMLMATATGSLLRSDNAPEHPLNLFDTC